MVTDFWYLKWVADFWYLKVSHFVNLLSVPEIGHF